MAKKAASGTKERVIADTMRYVENPDALMVSHGVASNQLESTRNMNISPSKMFEDKGHKLNVQRVLIERAYNGSTLPKTRQGIIQALDDYFTFCGENTVPPTLGGFAIWNGVTVQRINQVERDKSNNEAAQAIALCKDAIRNFLELSAMDSSINPIIYFHQNKVYYGAVENQVIQVRVEDNQLELSDEEYNERVNLLSNEVTMVECDDGVFRSESNVSPDKVNVSESEGTA